MNIGNIVFACSLVYLCIFQLSVVKAGKVASKPAFAHIADKGPFRFECNEWMNHSFCNEYETLDVMRAVKFLDSPPSTECVDEERVQGIAVCKDHLLPKCNFLTIAVTDKCEDIGKLTFEKHWSKTCTVTVIHFVGELGAGCPGDKWRGKQMVNYDQGVTIFRWQSWHRRCFACFFLEINKYFRDKVDVLKIQELDHLYPTDPAYEGNYVPQVHDGFQYTILSALWNYRNYMIFTSGAVDMSANTDGAGDKAARVTRRSQLPEQFIFRVSFNRQTLVDQPEPTTAHASNMIAARDMLAGFGAFHMKTMDVPQKLWPVQLEHFTARVGIDYRRTRVVSFIRLSDPEQVRQNEAQWAQWRPVSIETLAQLSPPPRYLDDLLRPVSLPSYCSFPAGSAHSDEMRAMQNWVTNTLNARCGKSMLSVACVFTRKYEAFIPCPSQLIPELALEYSLAKGWCDMKSEKAAIEPLVPLPASVVTEWNKPQPARTVSFTFQRKTEKKPLVRLAFFVLIHNDPLQVERLLTRLYSRRHYYMLHIDPGNEDAAFVARINEFMKNKPNIYISRDLPIIYPASSATICLVRAMAWYLKHIEHWDYFVTLTGSDYPLVPLSRMEYILSYQDPPMPFLMIWDPQVNMFQRNMRHANSVYLQPEMAAGIDANVWDRGDPMGKEFMQMRTFNYGTSTNCNGGRDYYRLDPRRNVTGQTPSRFASQFLFPLDEVRPRNPFAVTYHNKEDAHKYKLPPDGGWRKWTKSDPMFTGAYDRESVRYIVESNEGKRYFQYFSRFLMGSEEHYFSSLFYNSPRTSSFVTSLAAQTQWNTWKYGIYIKNTDGFKMHTHYLTPKELQLLRGMSKRGVFFARKFSTQYTADLQNMIDEQMLGIDCRPGHDTYCRPPAENPINNTDTSPYNMTLDAGRYWPGFLSDVHDLRLPWKTFKAMITQGKLQTGEEVFPVRENYYGSH